MRDADHVRHRLLGQGRFEQAVGRCLALGDRLLRHDHADRAIGYRLAGEPVGGEEQHLTRRRLGHQADVRDDHDRIGAQQVVHGFDNVDAGLAKIDGHAPHFRIAMVRQQFAPGRNHLIGIEQRHLRKGVGVQHHALRDDRLVGGGAPRRAVLVTGLRAREALHGLPLATFPVRQVLDPGALLLYFDLATA